MRTYTLKEVSKKINVSSRLIKQWEKDLTGLIDIPRSKQGSRIFTNSQINQLLEINEWYKSFNDKEIIRDILQKQLKMNNSADSEMHQNSLSVVCEDPISSLEKKEAPPNNTEDFIETMEHYIQTFINDVKNEIRNTIQKEVIEIVRIGISKCTINSVEALSDVMNTSYTNIKADLKELSNTFDNASKQTREMLKAIEKSVIHQSVGTSEELHLLSQQFSKTTEELSHYIVITNNEINNLSEAYEKDRETYVEDLEQLRHEIRQREIAYQTLLAGFRDAASTKEKKWWKFW